jgi:hypothetical protein
MTGGLDVNLSMPDQTPEDSNAPESSNNVARVLLIVVVVWLAGIAGLLALQTLNHPTDVWSDVIAAPEDGDLVRELNRAGALGWEVVSARRATIGESVLSTASYEMMLKRRGVTDPTGLPTLK